MEFQETKVQKLRFPAGREPKIVYGGDYNPEQWEESTWEEDMRLLKLSGVDILTLNVFSWASLQRDDDIYDFSKLDRIMELVKQHGFLVCLATSTGAHPAWMAKKHPDILRTDFEGRKRKFGVRHNSCPNSPTYRKYSALLAGKLAQRYQKYENIVAWHISNEYGGVCYCENCEKAFRVWLKKKYQTIEEVNRVWNTAFWGHTFYDFDEIVAPNALSEHYSENDTAFQGLSLDYARFNSDSILECYQLEYDAIKVYTPDIPITTNLMGFYKPLDYQKWANSMDFISWDSYPFAKEDPAETAMKHDLMRGLKDGQSFALMEQTPSVTNWQVYNQVKRPNVMRLQSYQAVAHGADTVMFFQMKRSIGACEKFHGAVIDHVGNENTRVFRECQQLGKELFKLGGATLSATAKSRAAIVFDWDNWWAVEYSTGPCRQLRYYDEVYQYYKALHDWNISVDFVSVQSDLSKYSLVVAPLLYMVKEGFDEKLKRFAENGGTVVISVFSGIVDEHDLVTIGGYPGKLRELLGIWVEETDGLVGEEENSFEFMGIEYPARLLCDIMHTEGAKEVSLYKKDFYQQTPVITKNSYGKGTAYYIGTRSNEAFYLAFFEQVCKECEIAPAAVVPKGIEAVRRVKGEEEFLFLLNHSLEEKEICAKFYTADQKPVKEAVSMLTGEKILFGTCLVLAAKEVLIVKLDTTATTAIAQ